MIEQYKIEGAPFYNEEQDYTTVVLRRDEPLNIWTVNVPENILDNTDAEIKRLAHAHQFKVEFSEWANAEQFKELTSANEQLTTQIDTLNAATMEIAGMVAQMVGGGE